MKLLNLRLIFLIEFLVGSVFAVDLAANQPIKKINVADLFNVIVETSPLSISKDWNDELTPPERWKKQMKEYGLKYEKYDFSDSWNIADQTGGLRVWAHFLNDYIIFL